MTPHLYRDVSVSSSDSVCYGVLIDWFCSYIINRVVIQTASQSHSTIESGCLVYNNKWRHKKANILDSLEQYDTWQSLFTRPWFFLDAFTVKLLPPFLFSFKQEFQCRLRLSRRHLLDVIVSLLCLSTVIV